MVAAQLRCGERILQRQDLGVGVALLLLGLLGARGGVVQLRQRLLVPLLRQHRGLV